MSHWLALLLVAAFALGVSSYEYPVCGPNIKDVTNPTGHCIGAGGNISTLLTDRARIVEDYLWDKSCLRIAKGGVVTFYMWSWGYYLCGGNHFAQNFSNTDTWVEEPNNPVNYPNCAVPDSDVNVFLTFPTEGIFTFWPILANYTDHPTSADATVLVVIVGDGTCRDPLTYSGTPSRAQMLNFNWLTLAALFTVWAAILRRD